MKHKIGDIVTVNVKIVAIDSDGSYQCTFVDGDKDTDCMYFEDTDFIDERKNGLEQNIRKECEKS